MTTHVSQREYTALAEVRYRIRTFLSFSERAAREAGIAPQQHQLLLAIRGLPPDTPATITRVAERLQLRHNSAVELVTRATRAGLILRKPGKTDRREVTLRLSARGERVLERLSLAHRKAIGTTSAHLIKALRIFATSR